MIDTSLVHRKMRHLAETLDELAPKSRLSLQDYILRSDSRRATERLIQIAVETATDINAAIITGLGSPPPKDYYGSFIEAGRLGVISSNLATDLAPSAGLRNRLVHEYDDIDNEVVHRSISRILSLYMDYLHQVKRYLDTGVEKGGAGECTGETPR